MPVEKGRPSETPRTSTRQRTASAGLEKNCVVRYSVLCRLLGQLCSHAFKIYVLSDFFPSAYVLVMVRNVIKKKVGVPLGK